MDRNAGPGTADIAELKREIAEFRGELLNKREKLFKHRLDTAVLVLVLLDMSAAGVIRARAKSGPVTAGAALSACQGPPMNSRRGVRGLGDPRPRSRWVGFSSQKRTSHN